MSEVVPDRGHGSATSSAWTSTGMPFDVVQQNLGSASLSTTTMYVTAESQRRMKAVRDFWVKGPGSK
jgi:site-specific recombinase XerD